jgi:hypothetical protein
MDTRLPCYLRMDDSLRRSPLAISELGTCSIDSYLMATELDDSRGEMAAEFSKGERVF